MKFYNSSLVISISLLLSNENSEDLSDSIEKVNASISTKPNLPTEIRNSQKQREIVFGIDQGNLNVKPLFDALIT